MILGDFHTHTRYSDGKGTVEQNVAAAVKAGLKQVAISDHGLKHVAFGLRQNDIFKVRKEIERLQELYDIQIFLSNEANIYNTKGEIDLRGKNYDKFDFVMAGYHKAVMPSSIKDFFRFNLSGVVKRNYSKSQIQLFTNTFVQLIKSGKVKVVTHLCYGIPVDVRVVGQAAADYGVLIELNGKKVSMTDEEVLTVASVGAHFIVNSDAHTPDRVGEFSVPMEVVERTNLDKNLIVNYDKIVDFDHLY